MSRAHRSISRSPRWTAEEAEKVISELERSGLSVQAFAARSGLESERLYRWRTRLGRNGDRQRPADGRGIGFTQVSLSGRRIADHHAPSDNELEIVLLSGFVVRVRPSFDGDALRRVLAILAGD